MMVGRRGWGSSWRDAGVSGAWRSVPRGGGSCENYCFLGKMLYRKQELEQVAYCPGVLSNDPIGVGQLVFRCRSRAEKKVGLGLSRWDWFGRLLPGNTRSGNAAIDAVFRVRCSDAELARRIFAREEVAGLLLANPWLLLRVETKWGYITVLLKDLIARMYTGEELASFARCVEAVADELLALYYAR